MVSDPDRPPGIADAATLERIAQEDGPGAARQLAQKFHRLCQQQHDRQSARCLLSLINLANAKQRDGQIPAALNDYREAIRQAELDGGPRDVRLFYAWNGLGYLHLSAGQIDSALEALGTALQLGRVNLGLYSVEQIEPMHAVADALLALGQEEEAIAVQRRRLETAERAFGAGSVGAAENYVAVGQWFRQIGRLDQAIALHALAVETLRPHASRQLEMIDALIEAALSGGERPVQFDQAPLPANARPRVNLERATELLNQLTDLNQQDRARINTRIGNAYLVAGREETAMRHYQKALRQLDSKKDQAAFDQPEFIRLRAPAAPVRRGPPGTLITRFTVTDKGDVRQLTIPAPGSTPVPDYNWNRLRRALRDAKLRPRILNGQFVQTEGVEFRLPVRGDSS